MKYGIAEVFRRGGGGNHTVGAWNLNLKKCYCPLKKLNKPERVQVNIIIILLRFFTSSFYFLVRGDMFKPCCLQLIIFSNYELQEILQIYYNFPLIFPMVLTRRTFFTIKIFINWLSFPLFLYNLCIWFNGDTVRKNWRPVTKGLKDEQLLKWECILSFHNFGDFLSILHLWAEAMQACKHASNAFITFFWRTCTNCKHCLCLQLHALI